MIVKFNAFNANSRGKNQDGQLSIKKRLKYYFTTHNKSRNLVITGITSLLIVVFILNVNLSKTLKIGTLIPET